MIRKSECIFQMAARHVILLRSWVIGLFNLVEEIDDMARRIDDMLHAAGTTGRGRSADLCQANRQPGDRRAG